MFTGIITDVGTVKARTGGRFEIETAHKPETIEIGASICCDGVCLTVTHLEASSSGAIFSVDVSNETCLARRMSAMENAPLARESVSAKERFSSVT